MSYRIGIDTIHLRQTPRLAHTEYVDHDALARHVRGRDDVEAFDGLIDAWDYDLIWATDDGPVPWAQRGRVTRMGHAAYDELAKDYDAHVHCPFTDPDEVLQFDAVAEYGLPDFDGLVRHYQQGHEARLRRYGDCVVPGGYYKSIVSGAIEAFGWDMLLLAAAELDRFERVLDSFFRLTLHHVRAWSKTSIEVFIQHDDFVWSAGPFMDPVFYRRAIIPRYAALWRVLHDAGKKVLFCSDADWSVFLDDIAEAGADGFIFEPMMALEPMVERYGRTHVLVGSKVDCRTLTWGTKDQIAAEVDATLELARDCPGFVVAVGNHIPSNVPIENAVFYMDRLRAGWGRLTGTEVPEPRVVVRY